VPGLMRYLTLGEVVELHRAAIKKTGGMPGIRDLGALDSALARPGATFAVSADIGLRSWSVTGDSVWNFAEDSCQMAGC